MKTYIIGHKSPDLDSVAAAISYAKLKNTLEKTDIYFPAVPGKVNRETEYILEKFGFEKPEELESVSGKNMILVDHNEASQSLEDIDKARILEVVDHHKVDFKYSEPISFNIKPWGSSCSIIAHEFFINKIEIDEKLAGLMLSAVLTDTVITKSPTCTERDIEIITDLAKLAKIDDWKEFGMEIFKVRSSIGDMSDIDIIKSDFKDYEFKSGKFGFGQVETVDLEEFRKKEDSLLETLKSLRDEGGYHTVVLFITDIIKEGSQFLVITSDQEATERALENKLENNKVYIDGVVSRKKQVVPKFTEIFD